MELAIYLGIGLVAAFVVSLQDGWQAGRWMLPLWPVVLPALWIHRQQQAWGSPPLRVKTWLAAEAGRSMCRIGGVTLLFRPKPVLDAPILLTPSELVLTPIFFRLRVCWKTRP